MERAAFRASKHDARSELGISLEETYGWTFHWIDSKTGDLLITYSAHNKEVRGVLFHPDGKEVYSSGSDNKVQRWTISEAKRTAEVGFGATPLGAEARLRARF